MLHSILIVLLLRRKLINCAP